MNQRQEVDVEGRRLSLSNLDKVLYPATGLTKAGVIDYYRRIAPALLPHLRGRALTLRRFPDGVEGESFFEKNCPGHRPSWIHTAAISDRRGGTPVDHCLVDDLPGLIWLANLAALELHVPMALADDPDHPRALVFDLDPGPPAGLDTCARVAVAVREVLAGLGLRSFAKTSGQKGLHVFVPLNLEDGPDQETARAFAHAVAEVVARRHPDLVVTSMAKRLRSDRVFIDWSQNARHKTTVGVYSLRATPDPAVSTPVSWDEIDAARTEPDSLRFAPFDVVGRVSDRGDLFGPVLEVEQPFPDVVGGSADPSEPT